jgi:hypothetical protein
MTMSKSAEISELLNEGVVHLQAINALMRRLLNKPIDVVEPLDRVEGDVLPPLGSTVLFHLASLDAWVPHTVVGYYVWPYSGVQGYAHRVYVRGRHANGYLNARMLKDIQRVSDDVVDSGEKR